MRYFRKDIIAPAVLFSLLLSSNIYTFLFADTLFQGAVDRLWYILVVLTGYITGLLLFRLRTFFIIAGIAQMVILPIEVSSLYLNGQPVSMQFMYWIISTNRNETLELLSSVWGLIPVVVGVWGLYGWTVSRIQPDRRFIHTKKGIVWAVLAVQVMVMLVLHGLYLHQDYTAPNKRVYAQIYAWSFGMRVGQVFPYDIYLQTYRAHKHLKEIDGIASLSDFRFGIAPRPDNDSALYVLVIGEAGRFQNFSINGVYERETNPLLSRQTNLVTFSHAYAEANATNLSVPLMLTRASADEPDRAYHEKTVAGAFQEAGYKAAWLTTKPTPIRYMQHILPSFDTVWITTGDVLDEALFDPFNRLINHPEWSTASSLVILHTKGSHLSYQDRYPESFARFEPCLKHGTPNNSFNKELMTNTYDNSILYTDYILHSLIQQVDSTRRCACLIYMPDHGENLCDDERKLWVHGSYEGSEWEFHVPLFVWYSNLFQEKYPDKVVALTANRDKQVSAQVLFHTLCDAAGLQEVVDAHYSLLSDSLREEHPIHALNGKGELINAY